MVKKTYERKDAGKIPEFDAIIVDLIKEKTQVIKFKDSVSLTTRVLGYSDVPVYFFSSPNDEYNVVAELPADYSKKADRGLLLDKIKSTIQRALEKESKGEVGKFDAIIFNPDDLSFKLIAFD